MKTILVGKKTYLVALVLALMTFGRAAGWIDQNFYDALLGFMGALGLGALRAGVAKLIPKDSSLDNPKGEPINL